MERRVFGVFFSAVEPGLFLPSNCSLLSIPGVEEPGSSTEFNVTLCGVFDGPPVACWLIALFIVDDRLHWYRRTKEACPPSRRLAWCPVPRLRSRGRVCRCSFPDSSEPMEVATGPAPEPTLSPVTTTVLMGPPVSRLPLTRLTSPNKGLPLPPPENDTDFRLGPSPEVAGQFSRPLPAARQATIRRGHSYAHGFPSLISERRASTHDCGFGRG